MTIRTVLALVMLTLVGGHGYTQPLPPNVPAIPLSTPTVPPVAFPNVINFPQPSSVPQPAKEKSLDQILDELEILRVQKAEIEKKEQELIKTIQQKAAKQAERMKQLGLTPPVAVSGPVRVGRIKIEGNDDVPDKKRFPAKRASKTRHF